MNCLNEVYKVLLGQFLTGFIFYVLILKKTIGNKNFNFYSYQLQFREIKIEFQKIQLLYSKFKKQFLNFQLQNFEYYNACIWKF